MSISKTQGKKAQTYMDARMSFKPGKSKYSPKDRLDRAKEAAEAQKERAAKAEEAERERVEKSNQQFMAASQTANEEVWNAYYRAIQAEMKKQAIAYDKAHGGGEVKYWDKEGNPVYKDGCAPASTEEAAETSVSVDPNSKLKVKSSTESKYSEYINKYAAQYNLDPNLVASVITIESHWDPNATSSANCQGLMQANPKYNSGNLYDPEHNIKTGCKILRECLDAYDGDVAHALVAYNAGINGAKNKPTSSYSNKVLAEYNTRKSGSSSLDVIA